MIGFQNLSISVSSTHLRDYEYKQIGRAIKVLGAEYLDKLSTVSTNLLISDQPDGPKYEFMAEHGRPIVTMEWLKQCVEQVSVFTVDVRAKLPIERNFSHQYDCHN